MHTITQQVVRENLGAIAAYMNKEAELQVLAMMRQSRELAAEAASGKIHTEEGDIPIDESFFFDETNRLAFMAMCDLAENGNKFFGNFEIVARATELARIHKIKDKPSQQFISRLYETTVESSLRSSVGALKEMEMRRRLIATGHLLIKAMRPDIASDELSGLIETITRELNSTFPRAMEERIIYGEGSAAAHMAIIEERIRLFEAGQYNPLTYPWHSWNMWILPPTPGKLHTVVMHHGHGKSTVTVNVGEGWAMRKFHVAYVVMEDQPLEVEDKRVVRWSGVPLHKVRSGDLSQAERQKVREAQKRIEEFEPYFHFVRGSGLTADQILRNLYRMREAQRLDVVIIDYMNAVMPSYEDRRSRNDFVAGMNDAAKFVDFSGNTRVPFVVADQINKSGARDLEKGGGYAGADQYGSVTKQHQSQMILHGSRTFAGKEGIWDNGVQVVSPGQLSPFIEWALKKQNDGRTGSFKQRLVGPLYQVTDDLNFGSKPA